MNNTDPPNGKSHKLKLTPELHRFIQRMGGYFESSGVPPIGGLILGLLMIAHEPLSAEDIASSLKVSRASVSTNFRVLLATGLIEKHTDRADRITYYVFPDTALEQAMLLSIQRSLSFKRIVEEGLAALPEKDASRRRLMQADEYAQMVISAFNELLVEWRARTRRPIKVASPARSTN